MDCPVCYSRFDKESHIPLTSHCGHSLCFSCVRSLPVDKDGRKKCPSCRGNFDQVNRNYNLVKLLNEYFCTQHTREHASFFCRDDSSFICDKCLLPEHRAHAYDTIEKLKHQASVKKDECSEMLDDIRKGEEKLKEMKSKLVDVLDGNIRQNNEVLQKLKQDILTRFELKKLHLPNGERMDPIIQNYKTILSEATVSKALVEAINSTEEDLAIFHDIIKRYSDNTEWLFLANDIIRVSQDFQESVKGIHSVLGKREFGSLEPRKLANKKVIHEKVNLEGDMDLEKLRLLFVSLKADSTTILKRLEQHGYTKEEQNKVRAFIHQNAYDLVQHIWFRSGLKYA